MQTSEGGAVKGTPPEAPIETKLPQMHWSATSRARFGLVEPGASRYITSGEGHVFGQCF